MAELSRVIWKTIPGTCGIYEVSNFGEIRDKTTEELMAKYAKEKENG